VSKQRAGCRLAHLRSYIMSFPSSATKESRAPVVRVSVDAEGVLPMTRTEVRVDHRKRQSSDSHALSGCACALEAESGPYDDWGYCQMPRNYSAASV